MSSAFQVMQKYFPLFPTYYGGVAMAHGSRIMGDNDDVNNGQLTWMTIWVKS